MTFETNFVFWICLVLPVVSWSPLRTWLWTNSGHQASFQRGNCVINFLVHWWWAQRIGWRCKHVIT